MCWSDVFIYLFICINMKLYPTGCIATTSGAQAQLATSGPPGPLFIKRYDVLPPNLVKSRSRDIGCCHGRIAPKLLNKTGSRSFSNKIIIVQQHELCVCQVVCSCVWKHSIAFRRASMTGASVITVKPVFNDHLYNKIYYLRFIQKCVLMKTEGINVILATISAFWNSSRWPLAT